MSRIIAKSILQFEDDETMLLFLLQNHKALDTVYQLPFVSSLFSKMFKNGIQEAEKYMIQQYSQSGYHSLTSHISEIVKDFQTKY